MNRLLRIAGLIIFIYWIKWLGSTALMASMIDLAFESHRHGDLDRAQQYYIKALESGEGSPAIIHYNLGNIYYAKEQIGDAVLSYGRAIKLAPSFKDAYLNLGRIQYLYGNYERALEVFLSYQKQDQNDFENTLLLADTFKKLRMYSQALEEYRRVVRVHPYHEEGYIALADFFLAFDDREAARREVVASYDNVSLLKSLPLYEADLLRETHRYDEAISVYRELLQGNYLTNFSASEVYDIELKIVDSLISASNINFAIYELEKLVEKYPQQKLGIDYLKNVYLLYERTHRGFSFFKKLYFKNPQLFHPVIRNFLADAYNRDSFLLVKDIIGFIDQNQIRDELAEAIKNELSL